MRSAPTWLFDLDNTLHDANPHVFPHINRAMREYIERHLGLDTAAANRLRLQYWQRYGATLLGLVRHHGTDPAHFLTETHAFTDLPALLVFAPSVRAALARLPGRKIVFSNGPSHYTRAVLHHTGLEKVIDAVYAINDVGFTPKPQAAAYRRLLAGERLDPRRCVMVEDSAANLATAKKLGMKTVWVSADLHRKPYVDMVVRNVAELPRRFGQL